MGSAGPLLRWSWLLAIALLAPAALPAGGGDRRAPQVRRRSSGDGPLQTVSSCALRLSPMVQAPQLGGLASGTPLRLLQRWAGDDGLDWLYVQEMSGSLRRGWLRA